MTSVPCGEDVVACTLQNIFYLMDKYFIQVAIFVTLLALTMIVQDEKQVRRWIARLKGALWRSTDTTTPNYICPPDYIYPLLHSDVNKKFNNLMEVLQWRAAHQGDKVAFVYLDDSGEETSSSRITFAKLHEESMAIAATLQEKGAIGSRALLVYAPGYDFLKAFMGCLYAGVVPAPLCPPTSTQNLASLGLVAQDAKATFVLCTKEIHWTLWGMAKLPGADASGLKSVQWVATNKIPISKASSYKAIPMPDPRSMAYLQYTSGSTSRPKGVIVSHENVMCVMEAEGSMAQGKNGSINLTWAPHFHDGGLINILFSVWADVPGIIVSPIAFVKDPSIWLRVVNKYRISNTFSPNFALELIVRSFQKNPIPNLDLSCMVKALLGAEMIRPDTVMRFNAVFKPYGLKPTVLNPGFGMAELTLALTGFHPQNRPAILTVDSDALSRNEVSVLAVCHELDITDEDLKQHKTSFHSGNTRILLSNGFAVPNAHVEIVDPETLQRSELLEGTARTNKRVGEVWFKSPCVTMGYYEDEQKTREAYYYYLDEEKTDGPYLRTGDLGFLYNDELYIFGRIKDVIIIGGRNIIPQDIELTVEQTCPQIRKGCVAAFSIDHNTTGEEALCIVAELREKMSIDQMKENIDMIRSAMFRDHRSLGVHNIIFVEQRSVPKTTSGKLQRSKCRDMFVAGKLSKKVVFQDIQ